MTIIVDLSVALKWYVAEDGSDLALAILDSADILAAPEYLHVEAANAMWAAVEKKRRFSAEIAWDVLSSLRASRILQLMPTSPLLETATRLAFEIRHPVYDCIYLAAALAIDGYVLTADRAFVDSATVQRRYADRVRLLGD